MKNRILLLLTIVCLTAHAQNVNIIPKPVSAEVSKGNFTLSKSTVIVLTDEGERNTADFFNDYLKRYYGFSLPIAKSATANYVRFGTLKFIKPGTEGKYRMLVSPHTVSIEGDTYQGTFYGMQTLIQLLPVPTNTSKTQTISIPCIGVEDYPRFSYRGMHLDVCRHFFPVDYVKKYIDYLALHKMNYFHWHLTDDQGWRIEIKKYPRLTQIGGYRNGTIIGRYPGKGNDNKPDGGFYTQEEIKDVVDYAAKRFITVVPEIEMPGHASAAIAAYPFLSCFPEEKTKIPDNMISKASKEATGKLVQETWGVFDDVFCAGKDSTFQFLQDVIDEVVPLFPGQYFHAGGDECPKNNWKRCPNCQKRIKDDNLKDEHELQSYFIQRMEKYVNSKGKTLIGWDEILEGGLAPNAIVMSWRGEQGGIQAAKENHSVIMTPGGYVYLDHSQSKNEDSVTIGGYTPLETTYNYEPIPKELPSDKWKFVLGAQGNLWTEYVSNPRKVEYMILPRASALSEVLWSPKEKRNFKDFEKRLPTQFKRYNLWKANYSKAYYDIVSSITPSATGTGLIWTLRSKLNAPIGASSEKARINSPLAEKYFIRNPSDPRIKNIPKTSIDSTYPIRMRIFVPTDSPMHLFAGNGTSFTEQWFYTSKATGKKITIAKNPIDGYLGNGGAFGLINGAVADPNKPTMSVEWQGWRGDDMEATIDLGKAKSISKVAVHANSAGGSRVYPPTEVQAFVSQDGKEFKQVGSSKEFKADANGSFGWLTAQFDPSTTRYVKVIARNYEKIPAGMRGEGDPALILIDEISVE